MPSIVSFIEENERALSVDEDYVKTLERRWKIKVDSPGTGPEWILAHITPVMAATYDTGSETDTAAIIKGMNLRADPTDAFGVTWILTVPYGPWDPYRHASSPLLRLPFVTMEGINGQKLAELDVNGVWIGNTAGDPYDPAPEMDEARCVIRVNQALSTFGPGTVLFYANKINADIFFGMPVHTVKIEPPKGSVAYHQACGSYWEVEWQFTVNPNVQTNPADGTDIVVGWDKLIPSRGYRQYVSGTGYQKIVNADGSDIDQAAYLSSTGTALTPPIAAADVIYTRWQVYREINFHDTFGFATTGTGTIFF